jgi:hypothetical protein
VVARYAVDVTRQACASKKNQPNLGFLVVVDGDNQGLDARKRETCGEPDKRQTGDRIAICVPTWSVETWVCWLCGDKKVRENRSYKEDLRDAEYSKQVKQATETWEPVLEDERQNVPSLSDARGELARLPGMT